MRLGLAHRHRTQTKQSKEHTQAAPYCTKRTIRNTTAQQHSITRLLRLAPNPKRALACCVAAPCPNPAPEAVGISQAAVPVPVVTVTVVAAVPVVTVTVVAAVTVVTVCIPATAEHRACPTRSFTGLEGCSAP